MCGIIFSFAAGKSMEQKRLWNIWCIYGVFSQVKEKLKSVEGKWKLLFVHFTRKHVLPVKKGTYPTHPKKLTQGKCKKGNKL